MLRLRGVHLAGPTELASQALPWHNALGRARGQSCALDLQSHLEWTPPRSAPFLLPVAGESYNFRTGLQGVKGTL